MEDKRESDKHWHLDRRVPLAIIFALALQTIYFTVFITKLDSRVEVLEKGAIDVRKTIQDMAEIKIHQDYISRKVDRIDDFLRNDIEWLRDRDRERHNDSGKNRKDK